MSTQLDPHLLATLDPEERAAFEEDDDQDDVDALKAIAGDDDADDDAGDDDDDTAASAPPVEGRQASKEPAPAPAAQDEPEPQERAEPARAAYRAELPQDYDAQLQAVKERDADLRARFKAGEIDIDERDAGLAELTESRETLLLARAKSEIAREMGQQSASDSWTSKVNAFLAETAKLEGIDYRKDVESGKALDDAVKMLANNPANEDKSMDWFLTQAHKWVKFDRGLKSTAPPAPPPADPKKAAAEKRRPDLSSLPKNLADVPGGDGPGDVGGEFAHLDTVDGEELEAVIAKMSPVQRERYLRGE